MNLKINEDFVCLKKEHTLCITSILPNQNEVYDFKGNVAKILEAIFFDKADIERSSLESKLGFLIPDQDWNEFIKFLTAKKILLSK